MKQILFVCSGNVARSQIAEAYYNKFCHNNEAISAGVDHLTPDKYPKLVDFVIEVMKEDGIDISKNTVKYITREMVNEVKKIIVMCDKNICPQFLLDSNKVIHWQVNDPYNTSLDNFRIIRDQIKNKVIELRNS